MSSSYDKLAGGQVSLSLIEFFENMVFRHGYVLIFLIIIGIPFFIKSKNKVIIFSFSYFLMFLIYFDQWLIWDLIKPAWYTKTLYDVTTFYGGIGTYTAFFRFCSSYSQIVSGFNIVLPILFTYAAYKLVPHKHIKIAMILFILFLTYESGIRPEVPQEVIGKADFQTAKWIRENTNINTAFVANIGSHENYLWNISGITERKCLTSKELYYDYLEGNDPLIDIDFEDMLSRNPNQAVTLLKHHKFTHLLISEESQLNDEDFNDVIALHNVYQCESNGKISRIFGIK